MADGATGLVPRNRGAREGEPVAKTRIAFVLSGGVSGGSYIAGALDEILRALKSSDQFEVDIISGASAGATNAALIAHGLCYRDGETDLHRVWVEKVDIVNLLKPDLLPGQPLTVFSSSYIHQLALDTVAWPSNGGPGVRAGICADDLTAAMTISNSTPLAYESRVQQPTSGAAVAFMQERNAEQETFFLDKGVEPTDEKIWPRVGLMAQASSAIPFVFPMVQLTRRAEDPKQYILKPNFSGERSFWYYDGGTFNNLPVDLAWYYIVDGANRRGEEPLENRRVIVVSPWRSNIPRVSADPAYPDLPTFAFHMLRDVMTESSAVQFQNEVIRRSVNLAPDESLTKQLPGVDHPPVELLGNFALVIPHEDEPEIRAVYLNHMSAFLDQKFREYDFRRGAADGRRVARDVLQLTGYPQQPEAYYHPDDDPTLHADITQYGSLSEIPSTRDPKRSVRDLFEDALDTRIDVLVKRFDLPGWDNPLTDALVARLVKGAVMERLPGFWNSRADDTTGGG